ncbi:uncharacterized protein A1O9_03819 [Exophiala aquamarina CBS 119918]|uniref:BTB domain-containing protein n=1 Tax=Exophiala aquamarina CBS 119918 TaxID=1182545 RepID=A0A072PGJ1_9EURO|nr:uncharacterized protein A1O9_03819 [Exophiala aquamarina CBS 119918]KEF58976.1 hypothetical protein A1O9_03819 [Exophiala aquamarina CBS 119918]
MGHDLPYHRQKARPSIQPVLPVLPELSRLFKAHSKKNVESSAPQTSPSEFGQSAVKTKQTPEPANKSGPTEFSSEAVLAQEDVNNTNSVEDKAVSASTASQTGTPSASTPATQGLAVEASNCPLDDDKEVISEKAEIEGIQQPGGPFEGEIAHVAESSFETDQMLPIREPERNLDSPHGYIDQSRSTSAAVEDEQQELVSSSATSVAADIDEKASGGVLSGMSQASQGGNHTLLSPAMTENNEQYRRGSSVLPGQVLPTSSPRVNSLPSLNEYFLHVAASKEYADWVLQVHSPTTKAQSFPTYAHSILLLRSHRMRRLMTRQSSYGTNVIELYPPRYVLPHAFESALRFLYSDSVIAKDFFLQQPAPVDSQAVRLHHLDYILSYWISGIELGLDIISERAETLLSDYLDWDLVEPAYKAADDIAKSEISSNSKHMTGTDYFVLSGSIVRVILHFLVSRIDVNSFKLDTSSVSTFLPSRLPLVDDNRARTNPALASMVFGSMPSSMGVSASSPQLDFLPNGFTPKDTLATKILLNLGFENLYRFNTFLQRRGSAYANRIMTEVVQEREARRERVLNAQHIPNPERMAASAKWDVVGHQEMFVNGVLSEKRVGFLLPSSR